MALMASPSHNTMRSSSVPIAGPSGILQFADGYSPGAFHRSPHSDPAPAKFLGRRGFRTVRHAPSRSPARLQRRDRGRPCKHVRACMLAPEPAHYAPKRGPWDALCAASAFRKQTGAHAGEAVLDPSSQRLIRGHLTLQREFMPRLPCSCQPGSFFSTHARQEMLSRKAVGFVTLHVSFCAF